MCYVPSPQMSLKPQLWQPWYTVFDLKDRDDIYGIVLVACVQIIDKQRGGDEQPAGEMGDPRIQNTTDAWITHVHRTYT